eukprot:GEMP01074649.1.p1 GENE.GEMP01074649.1~~GEMP01074649.1.p1  ORF type:complete len:307 (+),score=79.53 GEMP01074649.1:210-1130(+)
MTAPQKTISSRRCWADMNSDSDDTGPFFQGLAAEKDESYLLAPVKGMDDSKQGINQQFRSAADLRDDTGVDAIAEEEEKKGSAPDDKPMKEAGQPNNNSENLNDEQQKQNNFQCFNDTWKPNPTAVEFHPTGFLPELEYPTSSSAAAASWQGPNVSKKRARRVVSAGRALANGGRRSAKSSMSMGDNESVVESVSSMKPYRKRTKKNSFSDSGSMAADEEPVKLSTEQLEARVVSREKDVSRWKGTADYNTYLEVVPKPNRAPADPQTPDPRTTTMTKRQWKFNNELWQRSVKDRLRFEKDFPKLN